MLILVSRNDRMLILMINTNFNNEELLNRICEVYGFHQKIQLANHFNIAASSLQNRYTRGNVSYDFAVLCALETGADLKWLMTGEGQQRIQNQKDELNKRESINLEKFTISESKLCSVGSFVIDANVLSSPMGNVFCVEADSSIYIIEESSTVSEGKKLIDVDGTISIREIAVLPGKRLHVTGGKIPFECLAEDIRVLGRVTGVYREVK
ncbi:MULTISPECIES: phage repressor protein CI [unclassified Pantoea]|uniref:phage repressor protein CI n=1 Tax=unclassified Pantoea TaxID=2630326 RepID=UPI0022699471|nr:MULTISPECIES: phage repressor protein CI [unclassified Pantoea]